MRLPSWRCAGLLACGIVLLATAAEARPCDLSPSLFDDQPALQRTYGDLKNGRPVTIAALGGASTQGNAVGGDARFTWPERTAAALAEQFPGTAVRAVNLGAPRQTAEDMLGRIEGDLLASKPTLVVWETGTTDAVRGVRPEDFRETVQAGVDRLKGAGIDVMLMDMQYSHRTLALYDVTEYRDMLNEVAGVNDIPIFRRYDAMQEWSEAGIFDFDVADPVQRRTMAVRLYDCIGRGVAAMIVRAGQQAVAPVNAADGARP